MVYIVHTAVIMTFNDDSDIHLNDDDDNVEKDAGEPWRSFQEPCSSKRIREATSRQIGKIRRKFTSGKLRF